MNRETKDRIISGVVTFVAALLILLFLFITNIGPGREELATASIPEPGSDEEIFIEPADEEELLMQPALEDKGEENAKAEESSPSAPYQGEPDKSDVEQNQRKEPGKNPNPAPPETPQKTQPKTSPVKTAASSAQDEERQRATSKVAGAFSGRNGAQQGAPTGKGSSIGNSAGVDTKGSLAGRKFLGINKFNPQLDRKVTVKVTVTVNAAGKVASAEISSNGGADNRILSQCKSAALSARWEAKPGAADQKGTLTFTITPK